MNKLDALWEYQQAELALARLKREMKSSPSYQNAQSCITFLQNSKRASKNKCGYAGKGRFTCNMFIKA